jgi:formate-nitrite transporter family protein
MPHHLEDRSEPSTDEQQDSPLKTDSATQAATRLTAHQIFAGVVRNARRELERPSKALAFSGLAGGMTMGLTGLAVAVMRATIGSDTGVHEALSMVFYPVGFISVIIGRAQLFTENTLYPVVLILDERKHVLSTARLWTVVFFTNLIGAAAFAWLAVRSGALSVEYVRELIALGVTSGQQATAHVFWSGVIGGWIIALVAWMVTASTWTIGQIVVIWLLTYLVGVGHFAHCIATSGEILASIWGGALPVTTFLKWIVPATLGNIVGGVVIVSLLNYGQVAAGEED